MIIALMVATVQPEPTFMTVNVFNEASAHVNSAAKSMLHDREFDVIATNAFASTADGSALKTNATEFALP